MAGRLKPEEILLRGNRPEHAILLKLTAIVGSSGAAGMGRGAEALIEAEQKANATEASAWGTAAVTGEMHFPALAPGIATQEGKALWRERWETSIGRRPRTALLRSKHQYSVLCASTSVLSHGVADSYRAETPRFSRSPPVSTDLRTAPSRFRVGPG